MQFERLPDDVLRRLAARGINPEASCSAWLETIRDGGYDTTRLLALIGKGYGVERARREVPIVIPLAVVLPAER